MEILPSALPHLELKSECLCVCVKCARVCVCVDVIIIIIIISNNCVDFATIDNEGAILRPPNQLVIFV